MYAPGYQVALGNRLLASVRCMRAGLAAGCSACSSAGGSSGAVGINVAASLGPVPTMMASRAAKASASNFDASLGQSCFVFLNFGFASGGVD